MNIVLIGMPGCGKSTVGVILAKTIGVNFVDTDILIQQREGRLLQSIIDTDGIQKFLDREAEAIIELECDNSVIATGGSVVFRKEAIEHLKKNGKIFYLNVKLNEIKNRLNNISTRGIAAEKGKSIDEIFAEREALYLKYADCVLDLENSSVEETIEKILKNI